MTEPIEKNIFESGSYRSQVYWLRQMALEAIKKFPVLPRKIKFISHGENATFRVICKNEQFLLRLHRNGYHTHEAIREELDWLAALTNKSEVPVQEPVLSKSGNWVELQTSSVGPSRNCTLLKWKAGQIKYKGLNNSSMKKIGQLIGTLHSASATRKSVHRNYWDVDGLLGDEAPFWNISNLKRSYPKFAGVIEHSQKLITDKIVSYKESTKRTMSVIHADLHFGNMLWNGSEVGPIDFDDCGFGFKMYDLGVTIFATTKRFKKAEEKPALQFVENILSGYEHEISLTQKDFEILPYFVFARRLSILAWLNDRKGNPKLKKYLDSEIDHSINLFKKHLKNGPSFLNH